MTLQDETRLRLHSMCAQATSIAEALSGYFLGLDGNLRLLEAWL
jgi:hypothetical protein